MDKFTSKKFKILIVVSVVLLGLLIYALNAGSAALSNVLGIVSSPLLSAGTAVTQGTREYVNLDGMSKEQLKALYTELLEENTELREQLVDYYAMRDENASYESILSVKTAMPDLQLAAASVVGRDPTDVFYSFTINRGTLSDISVGDTVITDMGVVGVVEEAYATSSRVRTILSEKTQVGATAKESGESGVVSSDIQFANSGKVRMNYLTRDTAIEAGDIITTSGAGGGFPSDLLIGRVESIERSNTDSSFYAIITPFVDVKAVTDVFVITDFEGKGEVTAQLPEPDASEDPAMTASRGNE